MPCAARHYLVHGPVPIRGPGVADHLSLVYADKPQTLEPLEDNIRRVIADIRPQMLEKVIENWTSRLDYIRASRDSPMPEIIFKIDEAHFWLNGYVNTDCLVRFMGWWNPSSKTMKATTLQSMVIDTFGDRLISRFGPVNWPPRSCDLTSLDYFLWGYVKSLVYADKPQTLDHLEDNIRRVIADIRPQMLEKVIENWTSRLDYIRASRGSPMPEIVFKM
ncbi:uncharacterized protein TNCV_1263021 [Trichonephila clavipes]|nr:uncharacterized protein TNCV_1263021 [Trichonephila clavipes]